jgi:hypothetical protein
MKFKTLTVRGEKQTAPASSTTTSLKPIESYNLSSANRDIQKAHDIDVRSNDKLLEFVFDDDTSWMCDAATLHELFPESDNPTRSADGAFELPGTVRHSDNERGLVGDVALKLLNVFAKKPIAGGVAKIADRLEDKLMKEGEGLFRLDKLNLSSFDSKPSDKPFLLFIHGTNSNNRGAFRELIESDIWEDIKKLYGQNILAYQHRTLTKSPLQNVLELVKQLPNSADLHIISHSRGGLVGDIICRYSYADKNKTIGFTDTNIDLLRKEGNRENDIKWIKELNKVFINKKIRVKKFVRVACPAAGTKLASKRLETILNVFYNVFGGGLNPVADIIKELIAETLRTKDNINVLPGIEAQSPDSPFIKILNDRAPEASVDGSSLAVISGNGKLSVSVSGLLVILGKLFYLQRNDLVVNTDSMYLGANRTGNIQYFFDQGVEVDHVKYFLNNKTRQAVYFALKTPDGEQIPGFTCVPQHEVRASDRDLRGLEHGELYPYKNLPTGKKPIVVLLPGIMGSNISRNRDKLWLAYIKTIFGGLKDLQHVGDETITATSLIKTSYKQLADRLLSTYDVVIYPFDWRKQLNDCAKEFNDKMIELLKFGQPIKIIGHSMGGVLVRDFIINHDDTFKKLNAFKGFRIIFLGAPLGGSFRIPAVLFGYDSIINSLNMLDRKHTKKELLTMFSAFPGILSLLPLTNEDKYDFADIQTWEKMAAAHGDGDWPVPSTVELDVFKAYRDNILAKRDNIDYSNMIYIAGKDKYTPCDYYNDMIPPRTELVFLATSEGDQSVTWESGIPRQMIQANSVYYVDVTHGALANEPDIFHGIEDILEKGSTDQLSRSRPSIRGEEKIFRIPEVINFDLSERGVENAILGITEKRETAVNQIPVSISVSNGDLAYASYPVLAGHFINDSILYAEKAIDYNVNGSLSARHHLGLYPGEIGTNTVVSTDPADSNFAGTIIVGLGEPGNLTSYLLSKTVEQGISKYLLNVNSKSGGRKEIGISALIIGCGYGGLTVESSMKAIIEGVNNANSKVTASLKNEARTVQYIEFIELYEDRALNCLYTLKKIERKENRTYNIKTGNQKIKTLFGSKKRLPVDTSDEWWNRITVKCKKIKENSEEVSSLVFGASTGDAREEESELFSSTPLIDLYIEQASIKNNWTASFAKTLFELMIPNAFKDRLKKKGSISWILDKDTSAYPWELLQENVSNAKPLCIDAGMIRQLTTTNYRLNIKRVATEKALVVADPLLSGFVNQLSGAKKEGTAVEELLTANGYPKVSLINSTPSEIISSLFSEDYKIIHLAGHGVFSPNSRKKSGMVIGNNVFLTTADIEQMSTVPELVFVNCCHLGKQDAAHEKFYRDRYKLAANIGTQLIEIGVKAVIVAGWAVDDQAALDFATNFYSKMFAGYNFGDAVRGARENIYDNYRFRNNTWGAYQCYGDPYYKLINRSTSKKDDPIDYIMEEEAEIALDNLKNDLDTRNITSKQAIDKLKSISDAIIRAEIESGGITEREALIYMELGEYELAIEKYEKLRTEENANFSVAALEKYCNSQGKKCVLDFKAGNNKAALLKSMNSIIAQLKELLKINETSERLSLLGSSYKRKAMVTTNPAAKSAAYTSAATYYKKAYDKSKKSYPLNNWIVLQLALDLRSGTKAIFDAKIKDEYITEVTARKSRLGSSYRNMDYWELIDDNAYDLSLMMLDEQQAKAIDNWSDLEKKYKKIWRSSGSKGKKIAEIENLDIIADALSLSKSRHATFLKGKVDELRSKLDKEIGE